MAAFAVLFGTRHIDATEHQDGLMLAIATESHRQAGRVPRGRHLRDLLDVRRARRRCSRKRMAQSARRRPVLDASRPFDTLIAMTLLSFVAILLLPRQFHVTVVENNDEAEISARRLAVPALSRADQPVRGADRDRRPADLPAPGSVDSDMFVLALPLQAGSDVLHHRSRSSAACRPRPRW